MAATAAGAAIAGRHPLAPIAASLGFALWCLAAMRWRAAWLLVVPALLPLANLSPWTGWLAVDEFDLLVLGAIAGGHARQAWEGGQGDADTGSRTWGGLAPTDAALLAGFTALGLVAFGRGVIDAGGWRFDFYGDDASAANAWRVFKPLPYALLLAPLAWRELDAAPAAAARRFALGLLAGLGLVSLAVLWERAAYPGLLDWGDPYRATALFWEMHLGGAAIDAYLVLAMPFVAWALFGARTPLRWAAAALLALLAVHACLATFSRGVYGAVGASLLLGWIAVRRQRLRAGEAFTTPAATAPRWRARANALLATALVVECAAVLVAGTFARERVADIAADFGSRFVHWRRGVGLLDTPAKALFGIGTGRLPAHYAQAAAGHERSGAVRLIETAPGHMAARVSGPQRSRVLGGLHALTQRIAPAPGPHRIELRLRAPGHTDLRLRVCERHLLYPRHCRGVDLRLPAAQADGWQRLSVQLGGGLPARGAGALPRLAMFQLSVLTPGAAVDVARVDLIRADGTPLLANGDFSAGLSHWFPAAQTYFLPWHVDSLYLELLIERGALSLALFALLARRALGRLWAAGPHACGGVARHAAIALAAVLLLGAVSSVLDMPRVAWLLWLAIVVALRRPRHGNGATACGLLPAARIGA